MSTAARQDKLRALVVDRDETFLAFAAEALHSFRPGFDVATARSAEQAAEWLDTFSPDLLLMGSDDDALEVFARDLLLDRRTRDCQVVRSGRSFDLPALLEEVRAAVEPDER